MIKFYQGQWSAISGKTTSTNNIVFVTDRQVLMMGGKEYGKDGGAIKILAENAYTSEGAIRTDIADPGVASGTLFYFTGDQSILKYKGSNTWEAVQTPTLSAANLIDSNADASGSIVFTTRGNSDTYKATTADIASAVTTLEDKVEAAYENNSTTISHDTNNVNALSANHIVVSKASGIGKTDYVLDNGQIAETVLSAAAASDKPNTLDTTLVNGRTAAKIVEQISKNKTTIENSVGTGSGFITWTSEETISAGTVWTPNFHVLTGHASGALVNNNGTLETKFAIRKLVSGDTNYDAGYRSQYALFNEAGGSTNNTRVQIGDTINLVKDQFLKKAEYVIAWPNNGTWYEYVEGESSTADGWYTMNADGTRGAVYEGSSAPSKNAADRYLKFIFALSEKSDNPDTTASDTDSVVYINVNELFDSYKGVSGVAVNQGTNQISAVVATSAQNNEVRKTAADGTYLNNSANGLYVTGINDDIKAYIQDLGNVTSDQNYKFLTGFGVDPSGKLTGSFAQASAQFVQFSGITAVAGSGTTARIAVDGTDVDAALNSISNTIANLDGSYNGSSTANKPTEFVYAWTQTDGLLATSAKIVDSGDLKATSKTNDKLSAIALTSNGVTISATPTEKIVPVYAISDANDTTSGTLQQAINTIVTSVADTFKSLDMAQVGAGITGGEKLAPSAATTAAQAGTYKIVNTVVQNDGYVSATDLDLVAQVVHFDGIAKDATHIAVSGFEVGAALSSISQYIAGLDLTTTDAGTAPAEGAITAYKFVHTVAQEDGQLSATVEDLTAANVQANAITAVATGASSAVRVGLTAGTVQGALEKLSNIIADFGSFHNENDAVI